MSVLSRLLGLDRHKELLAAINAAGRAKLLDFTRLQGAFLNSCQLHNIDPVTASIMWTEFSSSIW